ncbi:MAG: pyridoxal phosphate-dependent decarboxylase family protein [Magnetovibrionaceae bacterium]
MSGKPYFDPSFEADTSGLSDAFAALLLPDSGEAGGIPDSLPETGLGESAVLRTLAPHVIDAAAKLGAPESFAHMDPPTPWITWAMALWCASQNQNLLHPATAPFARSAEERVIAWLAPEFGMTGGHMTPGSTLANLTALWAAREVRGISRIVASASAHISVEKAANILGLDFETIPTDNQDRLDAEQLPDLGGAALVLTAGTTGAGAIDPLTLTTGTRAEWVHVDAAWAGPLRLTRYADRLDGIEAADSVSVSAHKWLFQPKESALVLFKDRTGSEKAISFGGYYLAAPNIGIQGSHGAVAIPLLATLLAWGRYGMAERIERSMALADELASRIKATEGFSLFAEPETGVVCFRRIDGTPINAGPLTASSTRIKEETWSRCVAANPQADLDALFEALGL